VHPRIRLVAPQVGEKGGRGVGTEPISQLTYGAGNSAPLADMYTPSSRATRKRRGDSKNNGLGGKGKGGVGCCRRNINQFYGEKKGEKQGRRRKGRSELGNVTPATFARRRGNVEGIGEKHQGKKGDLRRRRDQCQRRKGKETRS